MKNLYSYILENEIDKLKDDLIKSINSINDEKFLKQIYKSLELPDTNEYNNTKTYIQEYLKNRAGIVNEAGIKTFIKTFKIYHCLKIMGQLFKAIEENNESKYNYFTSDMLTKDGNIFDHIKDFIKSANIEIDEDLEDLLDYISSCVFPISGITCGEYEHLTTMFLYDLNNKNAKLEDKSKADINSKKLTFEYKKNNGRITGNKSETKLLKCDVITETCKKLTSDAIKLLYNLNDNETDTEKNKNQFSSAIRFNKNIDDELDKAELELKIRDQLKELNNKKDIFKTNDSIYDYLDFCLNIGMTGDIINEIIIKSFKSQIPSNSDLHNMINDEFKFLLKNCTPINSDNSYGFKSTTKHEATDIIAFLWLVIGIIFYYNNEHFDYLIVFKTGNKTKKGDYVSLNFKQFNDNITIEKVWNMLKKSNISNDGRPKYTGKVNDNDSFPKITIKS